MLKEFNKKLWETFISILPLVVISVALYLLGLIPNFLVYTENGVTKPVIENNIFILFLICALFLCLGSSIFQLGADNALNKVGEHIGANITKKRNIALLCVVSFLLGLLITIAEPDLSVLGEQLSGSINPWLVKISIGVGVGIFFTIALIRIITQKSIKMTFMVFYFIIFAIGIFFGTEDGAFISLSFDGSGVTTGPATVPFVVAFGISVASTRGGKDTSKDSFGVTGIMSLGPILAMLVLGLYLKNTDTVLAPSTSTIGGSMKDWILYYMKECLGEVALGVLPIMCVFYIYNFIFMKLPKKELLKILMGFVYTFVGLYIFVCSAKIGFVPFGNELGYNIAMNSDIHYVLVIFVMILGCFIVLAEPSVVILASQVDEVSNGAIKKKSIFISLGIGVCLAITMEVMRVLYWDGFSSLYYLVPLYVLVIVLLPFVPDMYVGIAFDSGGTASGALASSFVLPLINGMTVVMNRTNSNFNSGYGVVGLIATMPILCIEILGASAKIKVDLMQKNARKRLINMEEDVQIIHLGD